MRRICLVVAVLGVVLYVFSVIEDYENIDEPLVRAFIASRADCQEMRLVAWKEISPETLEAEDMQNTVRQSAAKLSVEISQLSSAVASGWQQVSAEGQKKGADYQILTQATDEGTYLILRVIAGKEVGWYGVLRKEFLSLLGEGSNCNALIVGRLEGRYSNSELRSLFGNILSACNGRLVSTAYGDNYYSVNAYLEELDNGIEADGEEANLQIAADYLEKEGMTYIYFGLPLIYCDY